MLNDAQNNSHKLNPRSHPHLTYFFIARSLCKTASAHSFLTGTFPTTPCKTLTHSLFSSLVSARKSITSPFPNHIRNPSSRYMYPSASSHANPLLRRWPRARTGGVSMRDCLSSTTRVDFARLIVARRARVDSWYPTRDDPMSLK